ncbi:MAG: hypothetical protein J5892_02165 [Bacilli bacterium]|nr:hypothetical protein [Bacilli bacterium]
MNNLEFMSKFKPDTRCIKEFNYWIVCVRGKQTTLGDVVILLKRETANVGDMYPEEGAEFTEVVKWYEDLCTKKFGAVKFNYVIMMMKDLFVHYHAFPRYDKDINMFDMEWKDIDWPGAVNFKEGIVLEEDKLMEIKEYMKN